MEDELQDLLLAAGLGVILGFFSFYIIVSMLASFGVF